MSSPSRRQYWCHECNTNVQSVEGLEDPMCSRCHGSFLEELENNQPVPQDLIDDMPPFPPLLSHLFTALGGGIPPRSPTTSTSPISAGSARSNPSTRAQTSAPDDLPVGPDVLLARLMHLALHPPPQAQQSGTSAGSSSRSDRTTTPLPGGFQAGFQTLFTYPHASSSAASRPQPESSQSSGGVHTPPLPPFLAALFSGMGLPINAQGGLNLGDFVFSQQQLDSIMEQLGQQGPQPQQEGMPDDFFTKGLPDVEIIEAQVAKGLECIICQDTFSVGEPGVCKVGSCDHMFHRECVEPWLKKNHTCPTCRWDLLAEWKAAKEGRDKVPWASSASSSTSRSASQQTTAQQEQAAAAASGGHEATPGSWEPESEELD